MTISTTCPICKKEMNSENPISQRNVSEIVDEIFSTTDTTGRNEIAI